MLRWLWRVLFTGYNCDGCKTYVRRWHGRATPEVTRDYARLYCPSCADTRKEVGDGEEA